MDSFEGTTIGKGMSGNEESEVENLIKETLAATKKIKEDEKGKNAPAASALEATPIVIKKEIKTEKPKTEMTKQEKEDAVSTSYNDTFKEYKAGDIVKGTVVKIEPSAILVDIGYKAEGIIPPESLSAGAPALKVGDKIDVLIERLENKEGYVVLSKEKADLEVKWHMAYDAYKTRKVLDAKVISVVKGGLVVDCNGIRGFIPASQVAKDTETPFEEFIGKNIPIKIIQIDRRQGKVVLSHKLASSEKNQYEKDKIYTELEVGQVKHGKVTSLKSFGAFVDIGGAEGLVHLSELSWKRVNNPSQILKVGDEVDVLILGVDKETRKIALGYKQLQLDPWVTANQKYKPGQIIKVKAMRFTKFGAFVEIDENLEGLVHISEISDRIIQKPSDALQIGDVVEAKILRIIPEEQKIGLSIREVLLQKEREKVEEAKKEENEKNKITIGDVVKVKEQAKIEKESQQEEFEEENAQ